jgi:hypothetical protein
MLTGALIAESLRPGATLEDLHLVVTRISRFRPAGTSSDQPDTWTLIEFEAPEATGDLLASVLAAALDAPGWYADFRSPAESWVVFPRQVFHYRRGDATGRAEAVEHGRTLGIPEGQLDWPV